MADKGSKVVMFGALVTLTPADLRKGKGSLTWAVQRKLNRRSVQVTIAEVVPQGTPHKSTLATEDTQ